MAPAATMSGVRVLVVTNMYPPHHLGGYELSCQDVMQRWVARGDDVLVLTSDYQLPDRGGDAPGVPVRRELEWYWRDHHFLRPSGWRRFVMERRNQRRLRDAIRASRADVVSVWHLGGLSTGLVTTLHALDVPIVYVICDEWPAYAVDVDAWMSSWRRRPRLAKVAAVVTRVPTLVPPLPQTGRLTFVSRYVRDAVAAATGWSLNGADVVPSGIDLDAFHVAPFATLIAPFAVPKSRMPVPCVIVPSSTVRPLRLCVPLTVTV